MTTLLLLLLGMVPNDTSFVGSGGSMRPLKGQHPHVRLLRETIRIEAATGKVQVTFAFKNEGPAQRVAMGFPEEGYDAGDGVAKKGGFLYFRTSVDGKPLNPVRRPEAAEDESGYLAYWTKEVPFKAGQERIVLVQYQAPLGQNTNPENFVRYIVSTGANWKGKIGSMRVFVNLKGVKTDKWIFEPKGFVVVGSQASLIRKDVEPTGADNIWVKWRLPIPQFP